MKNPFEGKWVAMALDKIGELPAKAVEEVVSAVREEAGGLKVDVELRREAAQNLSADEKAANGWATVNDIIRHIDTAELAKKHPEAASTILKTVLGVVSLSCPVCVPIFGAVAVLPPKTAAKIVEYSGMPTPEHLLHEVAKAKASPEKLKDRGADVVLEDEDGK